MTSQVVITDQMRTPDERVTVHPFRHPWIKGTDVDPECGRTWHDHGWIDRGDHGFTVCPTEAERPDVAEARVREARSEELDDVAAEFERSANRVEKAKGATERTRYAREVVEVLRNRAQEVRRRNV